MDKQEKLYQEIKDDNVDEVKKIIAHMPRMLNHLFFCCAVKSVSSLPVLSGQQMYSPTCECGRGIRGGSNFPGAGGLWFRSGCVFRWPGVHSLTKC